MDNQQHHPLPPISRRDFLRLCGAAALGMILAPVLRLKDLGSPSENTQTREARYYSTGKDLVG